MTSTDFGFDYYVCNRYHSTSDPMYQDATARRGLAQVQGRGRCIRCGHQTFYSTRDRLQPEITSLPMLCAQCALKIAGAPASMRRQLREHLSRCPGKNCPYRGAPP